MSIGSLFKKLVPVAKTAGTIVVTQGTGGTLAATALRQLLLIGSGYLATKGVISGDDVQTVAAAGIAITTAVYGQLKAHKEKAEKIAAADPEVSARLVLAEKA